MSNFILGLLFYWLPVLDFGLVSWSPASFADFANTRPFSTLNRLGESRGSLLISADKKKILLKFWLVAVPYWDYSVELRPWNSLRVEKTDWQEIELGLCSWNSEENLEKGISLLVG